MKESDLRFMQDLVRMLAMDGVWVVPRSGLVLKKTGEHKLELVGIVAIEDPAPGYGDVDPVKDYEVISNVSAVAGISVSIMDGYSDFADVGNRTDVNWKLAIDKLNSDTGTYVVRLLRRRENLWVSVFPRSLTGDYAQILVAEPALHEVMLDWNLTGTEVDNRQLMLLLRIVKDFRDVDTTLN